MEPELVAIVESPLHVRVTLVEPTARVEVLNFALPALSCAVPRAVFPTAKVTGPVGLAVGEVMVAVNVTACPDLDGFGEDVRVTELVAWFTT
jgi:hypothetical protein